MSVSQNPFNGPTNVLNCLVNSGHHRTFFAGHVPSDSWLLVTKKSHSNDLAKVTFYVRRKCMRSETHFFVPTKVMKSCYYGVSPQTKVQEAFADKAYCKREEEWMTHRGHVLSVHGPKAHPDYRQILAETKIFKSQMVKSVRRAKNSKPV